RVALAGATIHDPALLFLDEPTAGVDPVSRRYFWDQIHEIANVGTTVLVTTHYMDEAERCHRLAFIFNGRLLDTATPEEVVANCNLSVAELEVSDAIEAAHVLRKDPNVDEVAHYGRVLRVVARNGVDAEQFAQSVLARSNLELLRSKKVRVTVEDAFVSM